MLSAQWGSGRRLGGFWFLADLVVVAFWDCIYTWACWEPGFRVSGCLHRHWAVGSSPFQNSLWWSVQ